MNKWFLSLIAVTLTALVFILLPNKLMAESKTFAHVIPFATNSGRVGFFDQANGMVYIYDSNLKDCVYKGQMSELGSTIASSSATSLPTGTSVYQTY